MALIILILGGFWSSYQCLVVPLSVKKHIGIPKSDEEMLVDRPFLNRKHQENEYLERFPYQLWYNDNLSCMLHWLYVKFTSLGPARSSDFSSPAVVKNHSFWLKLSNVNSTDNQLSVHDKFYH